MRTTQTMKYQKGREQFEVRFKQQVKQDTNLDIAIEWDNKLPASNQLAVRIKGELIPLRLSKSDLQDFAASATGSIQADLLKRKEDELLTGYRCRIGEEEFAARFKQLIKQKYHFDINVNWHEEHNLNAECHVNAGGRQIDLNLTRYDLEGFGVEGNETLKSEVLMRKEKEFMSQYQKH
jgi:hypothetical protein